MVRGKALVMEVDKVINVGGAPHTETTAVIGVTADNASAALHCCFKHVDIACGGSHGGGSSGSCSSSSSRLSMVSQVMGPSSSGL